MVTLGDSGWRLVTVTQSQEGLCAKLANFCITASFRKISHIATTYTLKELDESLKKKSRVVKEEKPMFGLIFQLIF